MSRISISTTKYTETKTREAEIDGVNYTVRKLGAGDQLDAAEQMRRAAKLKKQFEAIDDENEKMAIAEEMSRIMTAIEEIYVNLFDDGTETRENSKALVRRVGIENIGNLINDVFGEE